MNGTAAQALRVVAMASSVGPASAMALPADDADTERRCWLKHTAERTQVTLKEPTAIEFSKLRDGYSVASPLWKYRHFGKGQTATLLDLPPGRHTLRLRFAGHEHRPYFAFSPEVTVQVRGLRDAVTRPKIDPKAFEPTCANWYQDEVSRPRPPDEPLYASSLRAGEVLKSPFNVRLGVDGFGVCARGQSVDKTGHFMLEVLNRADRKVARTFDLSNGATQANVFVGVGAYVLRLRFVDATRGADLLAPHELPVSVAAQDRL